MNLHFLKSMMSWNLESNINIRLNTSPAQQMIIDELNNLIEQSNNCKNQ